MRKIAFDKNSEDVPDKLNFNIDRLDTKKKIPVFLLTLPILIFSAYPRGFNVFRPHGHKDFRVRVLYSC